MSTRGFSRRSTYLLLFGAAWIVYGLALHGLPQRLSLPLYSTVPISWQGWTWVVCGAVAAASTVVPRLPRPIGFAAASLPPMLWCLGFLGWWVTADPPNAWQGTFMWGVFTALTMISAGDEDVRSRP